MANSASTFGLDSSPAPVRPSSAGEVVGALCALVLGVSVSVAGLAQSPGDSEPAKTGTDETTLEAPLGDGKWEVRLRRTREEETSNSTLSLRTSPDGDANIESTLPGWAGPPKYTLRAEANRIGSNEVAILSTIRPVSEAGAGAVTLQIAWVGRREARGVWSWNLVRRVEHSTLESGRELALKDSESDAHAILVELQHQIASKLCGSPPEGRLSELTYEPDKGRFVRHSELENYMKDAKHLEGVVPDRPLSGPFTHGVYQWYWATSALDAPETTSSPIRPMQLGDRRGESSWTVDARDQLRGKFATAKISDVVPVRALHIVPGHPKDEESYRAHGRPDKLLLSFSDGSRFVVTLPDLPYERIRELRGVVVELPEPITTNCLSVLTLSAHGVDRRRGGEAVPVSLAEIAPITVVDAPTAAETAARIVDRVADEKNLRTREEIAHIANGVRAELGAAVSDALERTEGVERRRILPLLDHISPDRAVPTLIEFFRELDPDAVEFRAVERGLATHGEPAAEALAELLEDYEPENPKYIDIIRLLGRIGTSTQLKTIVDDLGDGSSQVRDARIRAVSSGGGAMLERLFSMLAVGGSAAQTHDVLTVIYYIGKRTHRDELGAHSSANVLLEVLGRTENRRTLMHVFRATEYFRVDGLVSRVDERFLDHSHPLVRRAAVEAVSRYPSPEARNLLERALEDRSPDVRIAAISGIGDRDDRRRATGSLLAYVRHEDWNAGREQALKVLAEVEVPETQEYFRNLLDRHRHSALALRASRVLSRASRAIDADLAREIALDSDAPSALRLQMVDLLGFEGTKRGEAFLFTLTDPAELASIVDDSRLRRNFEKRALMALGHRRSDRARDRLLKMAKTGSDQKLRRRAIRALAFYRGEDLLKALRDWRPDAPPELRPAISQTIGIIANRGRIDQVEREIDATLEPDSEGQPETDSDSKGPVESQ